MVTTNLLRTDGHCHCALTAEQGARPLLLASRDEAKLLKDRIDAHLVLHRHAWHLVVVAGDVQALVTA